MSNKKTVKDTISELLQTLDIKSENLGTFNGNWLAGAGQELISSSPIDGAVIAGVKSTTPKEYQQVIAACVDNFHRWRNYPAPKRGLLIRDIADELRKFKEPLGELITREVGKIRAEGEGEVQEAIDIADFAVGLSRQLYGYTMHSERALHRMYEQWHPLGTVGVITAFNFPVAVWAWNAMLAAVCGNTVLWKPSDLTPLSAIATIKICSRVAAAHGFPALFSLVTGSGPELGKIMAEDVRLPLISATGSCQMGRSVGQAVAARLGRSLLELGGNGAITVLANANLELAVRAVVFSAVGTSGQRCTSTRRVLVEKSISQKFISALVSAYKTIKIGNPLEGQTLMGPLVNAKAVQSYTRAVEIAKKEGAEIIYGGSVLSGFPSQFYVQPTIIRCSKNFSLLKEETFAPVLYIREVASVEEAIAENNSVPQGLSSAIFTNDLQAAERFLSATGSDCGIANVNIGTSGAEIGGAFGGEKDTGGGREAGSDSWRAYMRRQTNTINWGSQLPLAQGIKFD